MRRQHYSQVHFLVMEVCIVEPAPPRGPSPSSLLVVEHKAGQSKNDEEGLHTKVPNWVVDLVRILHVGRNAFEDLEGSRDH